MPNRDDATTIQELKQLVAQFRNERGWGKHHTPKNLAISIVLEAAELLEHFQWDSLDSKDKAGIADELADILSYCFNFAETMDIDISTTFRSKLKRAAKKYPLELFNPETDSAEAYTRIKREYRQKES